MAKRKQSLSAWEERRLEPEEEETEENEPYDYEPDLDLCVDEDGGFYYD